MIIVKNLIMDFEGSQEILLRHNIFDLHIFNNETAALLNLFEICMEMHFVSLFFLKERNITTSLLMIHLKCAVVHYANLNSSSRNKSFLTYGPLNMLLCFFKIHINNYHFLIQIYKIDFKMQYIIESQFIKPFDTKMAAL